MRSVSRGRSTFDPSNSTKTGDTMKNVVMFHDDLDGWVAAWLLRGLRRLRYDETLFLPYDYGETLPPYKEFKDAEHVYFLDLQFDSEVWTGYFKNIPAKTEVWDHHEGCIKYYPGAHYDPDKCTARLVWEEYRKFCDPRIASGVQRLVNIVDMVDLHIEGDHADYGCAVLEASVLGIPRWKGVCPRFLALDTQAQNLSASIHMFMATGQQIFKWKQGEVNRLVESAYVVKLDGQRIPMVNTQSLVTEVLNALSLVKTDIIGCYWYTGTQYEVRLRAQNDSINVVEIAQRYGGGGHGRSAGFRLKTVPWTKEVLNDDGAEKE